MFEIQIGKRGATDIAIAVVPITDAQGNPVSSEDASRLAGEEFSLPTGDTCLSESGKTFLVELIVSPNVDPSILQSDGDLHERPGFESVGVTPKGHWDYQPQKGVGEGARSYMNHPGSEPDPEVR